MKINKSNKGVDKMDAKTFYGTEQRNTITYLEFGEIDIVEGEKKIWNFQLHQKAYDWLMLGRYSNDLFNTMKMEELLESGNMQEMINLYNEEIHHEDEASLNLAKLIAVAVTHKIPVLPKPSFYELGQTIFGCIEGMEFYKNLLKCANIKFPDVNLKNVTWYGVDISELFNYLSLVLHQNYNVVTMLTTESLPSKMDVFFAKGISILYAVRTLDQFFATIRKGKLAVFDYSFSLGKEEDTTIGSGKTVRYLNYSDFLNALKKADEVMYVKKSNSKIIKDKNRIWLDCIFGEKSLCEEYIKLDTSVRIALVQRFEGIQNTGKFLNNDISPEWVAVENYHHCNTKDRL
ncbi:MAG: hypothetical protein A2103_04225 [Gammaproteobacteria bacterium GWF2_41_13]|nr:MAG: hypothetical protein A2103_04225 [Gammaproteobacteria bacterium GWF2_41_13]